MLLFLTLISYALTAYYYVLIASILLSWIPELRKSKIGQTINQLANPYMRIFRGLLVFGMMDFTPIIGFILYRVGLDYFNEMIRIIASR
ncbi:YGGT family protein [Candidatus Izimaplasma bacterium HR1]|jgi:YggT family protein|uniref:YggT family protein n=1 Tax=Candidatus Izimoplasma sp. HR1 TaxID=1541959 RepID=UPI0004F92FF3|nr:YGGT family protein [Candidatus Izimaplasma bacterium HR1]